MKIIIKGINEKARYGLAVISGKDDSVGTSEREMSMISVPFLCSEGAVEV